jgi:hypothetical protein
VSFDEKSFPGRKPEVPLPETNPFVMKTTMFASVILMACLLPGCLVKSLHPFYTENDVMFREELLGTWTDKDSSVWVLEQHKQFDGLMKPEKPVPAYDVTMTDNKGTSRFLAILFALEGQLFLDFFPSENSCGSNLSGFHMVPSHSLAKVDIEGESIRIGWYNEQWLVDLFNKNRVRIQHERVPYDVDQKNPDSWQVILTAPTDELQKFIRKYGNDPGAFRKDASGNEADYTFVLSRN